MQVFLPTQVSLTLSSTLGYLRRPGVISLPAMPSLGYSREPSVGSSWWSQSMEQVISISRFADLSSGQEGGLTDVAIEVLHKLLMHVIYAPKDQVGVGDDQVTAFLDTLRRGIVQYSPCHNTQFLVITQYNTTVKVSTGLFHSESPSGNYLATMPHILYSAIHVNNTLFVPIW